MNGPGPSIRIDERGTRASSFGEVVQLKVWTPGGYRPLFFDEVYDAFTARYPGRWAVEVYPPRDRLVDGKPVRHLWMLQAAPEGLDLRTDKAEPPVPATARVGAPAAPRGGSPC